jgi:BlaI family transcriptional regulator, penicillinase repressor
MAVTQAQREFQRLQSFDTMSVAQVPDKLFCIFGNTLEHAIALALLPKRSHMAKAPHLNLTRRERQIMDILYRRRRATAGEVMAELPGDPSYSTVRAQLRVLEDKQHVRHEEVGLRYVYSPIVPRHEVRLSALKHLVDTFFEGSTQKVVAALLGSEGTKVSAEELERIAELVEKARKGANK